MNGLNNKSMDGPNSSPSGYTMGAIADATSILLVDKLPAEQDAALSLCSMMHQVSIAVSSSPSTSASTDDSSTFPASPSLSRLVSSDDIESSANTSPSTTDDNSRGEMLQKNQFVIRKKRESTKRQPRINYEEMKRLMRVYGPTKCLRYRKSKLQGNTNALSVKRKFYRWFPDIEERFEKTDLGWYKPRIGHEAEMKYREELRRKDQKLLTSKRSATRSGELSQPTPNLGPLRRHLSFHPLREP